MAAQGFLRQCAARPAPEDRRIHGVGAAELINVARHQIVGPQRLGHPRGGNARPQRPARIQIMTKQIATRLSARKHERARIAIKLRPDGLREGLLLTGRQRPGFEIQKGDDGRRACRLGPRRRRRGRLGRGSRLLQYPAVARNFDRPPPRLSDPRRRRRPGRERDDHRGRQENDRADGPAAGPKGIGARPSASQRQTGRLPPMISSGAPGMRLRRIPLARRPSRANPRF